MNSRSLVEAFFEDLLDDPSPLDTASLELMSDVEAMLKAYREHRELDIDELDFN